MRVSLVFVAVLAMLAAGGGAKAQSVTEFGGPRDLPPDSFPGQDYVDSRGCVFLRAELDGRTTWVPRVSPDRVPRCGYPPSFGAPQAARVDRVPPNPPVPKPPVPAIDKVASTPPPLRIEVAPLHQRARARSDAPAPPPAQRVAVVSGRGKVGCYADAPVAERFRMRGGGTRVMCTRGDGNPKTARAPQALGGERATGRVVLSPQDQLDPPKGYKRAWKDDRLNPNRAIGTRAGWQAQDRVWTRETPARLVDEGTQPKTRRESLPERAASPPASPAQQVATGRLFVQVGTFGVAANAKAASNRLAQLGLPVARSRTQRNGAPLQTVLAGPFASQAEALAALSAARQAGFGDAFLR